MPLLVSVVAQTAAIAQAVRRHAIESGQDIEVQAISGGVAKACELITQYPGRLVALELDQIQSSEIDQIDKVLAHDPLSSVVLLTPERSAENLLVAMRAGIREVMHLPLEESAFVECWSRHVMRHLKRDASRPRRSPVIAFVASKGGVGATFLATSFAHALTSYGQTAVVIDLNTQFGDAALLLSDQQVHQTFQGIASQIHRLDGALFESALLRCGERLWVLPSLQGFEKVDITTEVVHRVIDLASQGFDHVVLDLGRAFDQGALQALRDAQEIQVVITNSLPSIHHARNLLSYWRAQGFSLDKTRVVINRHEKTSAIGVQEVCKALGLSKTRQIPPSDRAVAMAINRGEPIGKTHPHDPVAVALQRWADEWTARPIQERRPWRTWFRQDLKIA